MNAARQPNVRAMKGTSAGAMIAPTLVPELKMDVANARSRFGNHSAMALIADGKLPPSLTPRKTRAREEAADRRHQRVAHGGDAPERDRRRVADLRAVLVDEPAEQEQTDGVGPLEGGVHQAELLVGPPELLVEELLDERQDLPVDVVDRRRQEDERADDPAVLADGAFDSRHGMPFRWCLP